MTTSMSCFLRLSSFGGSSSSMTSPSMRARKKPCVFSSSSFSLYSPLRACTTGASSMIFVPCGSAITVSTICEHVLRLERRAVIGAARNAGARVEQAQVVVDLGDGADRRARVVRRALLLDRDRGRQALDVVDVGLLHHRQELARVRGQRLDVAALALGVERVERQATTCPSPTGPSARRACRAAGRGRCS